MRAPLATSPDWRALYEAALRENDPSRVRDRITAARTAIFDTVEDTLKISSPSNQRAMNDALRKLKRLEHTGSSREAA
ncbi:MAG: hypothetical protein JOZ14_20795 [Acidobacteria bacterium]|nr:hypothetical protein [Acidobacteriota bacterium]